MFLQDILGYINNKKFANTHGETWKKQLMVHSSYLGRMNMSFLTKVLAL